MNKRGSRMKTGFLPMIAAGLMVFVPVHMLTFSVVPVNYRVAWTSMVSVLWTAYMSCSNEDLRRKERTLAAEEQVVDKAIKNIVQERLKQENKSRGGKGKSSSTGSGGN